LIPSYELGQEHSLFYFRQSLAIIRSFANEIKYDYDIKIASETSDFLIGSFLFFVSVNKKAPGSSI